MHGEIFLGGHPEKEGQHVVVECQHDHLLDLKHIQKFQVHEENQHLRDRVFSHHIYVPR